MNARRAPARICNRILRDPRQITREQPRLFLGLAKDGNEALKPTLGFACLRVRIIARKRVLEDDAPYRIRWRKNWSAAGMSEYLETLDLRFCDQNAS